MLHGRVYLIWTSGAEGVGVSTIKKLVEKVDGEVRAVGLQGAMGDNFCQK